MTVDLEPFKKWVREATPNEKEVFAEQVRWGVWVGDSEKAPVPPDASFTSYEKAKAYEALLAPIETWVAPVLETVEMRNNFHSPVPGKKGKKP